MNQDIFGNLILITSLLCGVLFFILYLVSLVWVYSDAGKHDKTGCMWALIVFFTWPFGLIAYLMLRDQVVKL
jgi:hypothetical protein